MNKKALFFILALAGVFNFLGKLINKKGKGAFAIFLESIGDLNSLAEDADGFFELDDLPDEERADIGLQAKAKINTGNPKLDLIFKATLGTLLEVSAVIDTPQNEGDKEDDSNTSGESWGDNPTRL